MLIGEVCRFYGWSFKDVWEMPARRFFSMHRAARKLQCFENLEQIDIQAISICSLKWHDELRNRYSQRLDGLYWKGPESFEPILREVTEEQRKETKSAVMKAFALRKRLMGYG